MEINNKTEGAVLIWSGGRARLLIDGCEVAPVMYGLSDIPASKSCTVQAQRNIRNFAKAGIHLVNADTDLRLGWHKAFPFDTEPILAEIRGCIEADPDTRVMLRLHVNPPYWWLRDHPEECTYYNGRPGLDDGETARLIQNDSKQTLRVSLASERWLSETEELLRQLCTEIADTEEGHHLFAIQVACGLFGEWHQWGCDSGPAMEKRFRRYLRETYSSVSELRKAWGRADIDFDNAPFCPDREKPGTRGDFRDPVSERCIMDSQRAIQCTPPEAILRFCRVIQENWPRPILTGTFYGYFLGANSENAVIDGHLRPDMLFEHRDVIQFLCGPFPYMDNRKPEGAILSRGLLESLRLHRILWLTEMDERPAGVGEYPHGDPARIPETNMMMTRSVMLPLLCGHGLWFYDHRVVLSIARMDGPKARVGSIYKKDGWWELPGVLRQIGKIRSWADANRAAAYQGTAEVLVVCDPNSYFSRAHLCEDSYLLHHLLGHSGAAVDYIYLSDLPLAEKDRYRAVIFQDCCSLSEEDRKTILSFTEGKQVLWFYAPGYSDGSKLAVSHIEELTGMRVEAICAESACRTNALLFPKERLSMPEGKQADPAFAVVSEDAEALTFYEDSGHLSAARKGSNWYFALPLLNQDLIDAFLKAAGVHIYSGSHEPLIAGNGAILLQSVSGGTRSLRLKNGKVLRKKLPPMSAALFDSETGKRIF